MNKRHIGSEYENQAAIYLEKRGMKILERNYRNRQGEIDIIAKDGSCLCFVEVKYRETDNCGTGAMAVNYPKQKKIIQTARYYMMIKGFDEWTECRFDVISFDRGLPVYYENAFEADA